MERLLRKIAGFYLALRYRVFGRRHGRLVLENLDGVPLVVLPSVFNPVLLRTGALLARVTQVKQKGSLTFVGCDAGMSSLIRPALYGAYHEIVNLSRLDEKATQTATIVGPICESADVFGHARRIATAREGDVLLIGTTGAYGRAMSSRYNLREPAAERFLARQQS